MIKKHKIILADIGQFTPENTLYKVAKKHKAKDFVIIGDGINLLYGVKVSHCIIISETIEEKQARNIINEYWKKSDAPMKIFAWIPLNNMKDMVVCNIEKNPEMRVKMLTLALEKTGAKKYIQHNTDMDFVKTVFMQLQEQKEEA
tara:strand:- start:227 stop:661 length:435 start_codon:yes stop_codon:yes gene_type:complete